MTLIRRFLLYFGLFLGMIVGCDRPNPNPELLDPVYKELQADLAMAKAEVEAARKAFEEAKLNYEKAQPQTGQVRLTAKRFFDAEARLARLQQTERYYSIRVEAQINRSRIEYLEARAKKEPWPNAKAAENLIEARIYRSQSKNWNQKERVERWAASESPSPKTKTQKADKAE